MPAAMFSSNSLLHVFHTTASYINLLIKSDYYIPIIDQIFNKLQNSIPDVIFSFF